MIPRPLTAADTDAFIALLEVLDRETEYLMFEPGERPVDRDALEHRLGHQDRDAGIVLGAFLPGDEGRGRDHDGVAVGDAGGSGGDDRLVGFLGVQRRQGRRNRHVASIVIALLGAETGKGRGRALLDAAEAYALGNGVRRLELGVLVGNERAIRLYESFGFEREGSRRRAVRLGDTWHDELSYAKLLPDGTGPAGAPGSEER